MTKPTLEIGSTHTFSYRIPADKTVPYIYPEAPEFQTFPPIFATGFLVALMEWACVQALHPRLDDGFGSLGTAMDMTHIAPTPVGFEVTVKIELLSCEGREYVWRVEAHDEQDKIGTGTHRRMVIDRARFDARLAKKQAV